MPWKDIMRGIFAAAAIRRTAFYVGIGIALYATFTSSGNATSVVQALIIQALGHYQFSGLCFQVDPRLGGVDGRQWRAGTGTQQAGHRQ